MWHVCFPGLHCSGSRLLYRERALSCMQFQFSGTPQRHGLLWACVLCLPSPSSSGNQELDGCTLPGCGAPYTLRGPSLSFRARWLGAPCVCSGELVSSHYPPGRCQPSRISGSLWLETGSLFAVWLGVLSLGLSLPLSPPPCLLPPVGDGQVHRQLALLWNCSVFLLFCQGRTVCSVSMLFAG